MTYELLSYFRKTYEKFKSTLNVNMFVIINFRSCFVSILCQNISFKIIVVTTLQITNVLKTN